MLAFTLLLMTRVKLDKPKRVSASQKSALKRVLPPTPNELKEVSKGLHSLTDDIKVIQKKWIPSTFDIDILTAKFRRLNLKSSTKSSS